MQGKILETSSSSTISVDLSATKEISSSSSTTTTTEKPLNLVLSEMGKVIVGQENMTRCIVLALLTSGHALIEGLPGLAKTLAVKTLAQILHLKFQRIQFTPDLLPSDLIGTMVYREHQADFVVRKGPIFANIVLADEINRASAKVQSALLEAMAEGQVTIGDTTYPLPDPFLVLATQNPIEQEGTYVLPEAQLDRFLFKIRVHYPSREEERQILERSQITAKKEHAGSILSAEELTRLRHEYEKIYLDDRIKTYILRLVLATRKEEKFTEEEIDLSKLHELRQWIRIGASPRATIFLAKAAKANAFLEGRNFTTPEDVKTVAAEILRHRLILTFEAEAENKTSDHLITELLHSIHIP